ncbi:ArsA family ATPase [Patulibacter defluvii]|uniref:ArsA family ATPase n=1 Tax=Patulibacter defluvii TaxID=3095358 RepID=UPI002A75BB48|nr:ArsA-related P-loop ATPase [Patulibacter sp. DM4]
MPGELLHRRLIVVTGKGGVGKSTVAAALAVLAARQGRRTVIAEVGRRGDVAATLDPAAGVAPGESVGEEDDRFDERRLPGPWGDALWHVSVSPEAALREYLRDQLPIGPLAELLRSSRVFTALTAATPGMRELLAMGKVWELSQPRRRTPGAQPYDLCVMDAPASGHAATILGAPAQFAATARVGPVARQGQQIAATIVDPAETAVVVVATAEELPVSEAIELEGGLRRGAGVAVTLGIANGLLPDRFAAADRERLAAAGDDPAIVAARGHAERAHDQQRQLARLRREASAPVVTLPFLPARRLGPDEIGALADRLGAGLRRLAAPGAAA